MSGLDNGPRTPDSAVGRKVHKCPHCPVEHTTAVNLRAHILSKHGLPAEQTLANSTTEEILGELEARMAQWPSSLGVARAVMRGTTGALHKAAETVPEVADVLNAVRGG